MQTITKILLLAVGSFLVACQPPKTEESKQQTAVKPPVELPPAANDFVAAVETAHNKKAFMSKKAVSFDIDLSFGDKQLLDDAKITMLTNSAKIRIDRKDSVAVVYDGQKVFITPDTVEYPSARFDIFTWAYFFAVPYKLSDPGTKWEITGEKVLSRETYNSAKLSFEKGTGDAPDDWYILYSNPENNLLQAMAYIVTFFGSYEEASKDPHGISYDNYTRVEGVAFAQEWRFSGWNETEGFTEQVGQATLSNITFTDELGEDFFRTPPKHRLVER